MKPFDVVLEKFAPMIIELVKSVLVSVAPLIFASVRIALLKLALVNVAYRKSASVRSALVRMVFSRFASRKDASYNQACVRSREERSAYLSGTAPRPSGQMVVDSCRPCDGSAGLMYSHS